MRFRFVGGQQRQRFGYQAVRVHVDGLDALALEHHGQALGAGFRLRARGRGVEQAAAGEYHARRGGRVLDESLCEWSLLSPWVKFSCAACLRPSDCIYAECIIAYGSGQ